MQRGNHQLSCILDSSISASYEASQALATVPTVKRFSTSSEEHCANLPGLTHEDVLQEHIKADDRKSTLRGLWVAPQRR